MDDEAIEIRMNFLCQVWLDDVTGDHVAHCPFDTDDAEAFEAVADLTETLHSCEYALGLGSAAPAPVAEVA